MTLQDVVLIFVTVSGMRDGRLMQETYAKKVYNKEIGGKVWSAIQVTTASGICAMVDLMRKGRSEEHTSELQSLMRISSAVFCLKKQITLFCRPSICQYS